ncbi:MAG: FKBP-type peptidyl-prolyl cis-trans isomerase [Clostridiales bacterium]|nr:FKBP-type peptidyl-prolyl cis-trans isomerase [Candidatus Blautia equi]
MKKRAYLALLILCAALMGTACENGTGGTPSSENTSGSGQKAENTENGKNTENSNEEKSLEYTGARLVSVDNLDKYLILGDYKGLSLDKSQYAITDEKVEEIVRKNLLAEKTEVTAAGATVQSGDRVTVSYVGTVAGRVLEEEKYFDFTVGEGAMAPAFEEALTGMKKGESKIFQIVYPEDFEREDLAGKPVTYKVMLQSFQRTSELTDALAKNRTDAADLAGYRAQIRAELEAEAEELLAEDLKAAAWNMVLVNSEVREYPKADLNMAMDQYKRLAMLYNNESDMDLDTFLESQGMTAEEFQKECERYAEQKVKQNLILQAIMDAEGITLEDQECLIIQDQLLLDFKAASMAELLDTYGQAMIDESIALLRIEDLLIEQAVFAEPAPEQAEEAPAETVTEEEKAEEEITEEIPEEETSEE